MANPAADFPTNIHSATDVPALAGQSLGGSTPKQTSIAGKAEAEIVATQQKLGTGASTPTLGKVLKGTGTGTSAWQDEAAGGGGVTTELLVAASDAPVDVIAAADYICDGTADDVQIQEALDLLKGVGGIIRLSEGNFAISAALEIIGEDELDDTKNIAIIGCGKENTILTGANNVDVFDITNNAMFDFADFRINVRGSGDGIYSHAGAGNTTYMRSFWHSSMRNIHINGGYSAHTGWGMNLGSPFRSTFDNIEIDGVKNGFKGFSEYDAFNPGDCVVSRMFIDLYGGSGVAYQLDSPEDGFMNQMVYIMCEAIGQGTGCTGILLSGTTVGSSHNRFIGTNLEQFDTIVNVSRGEGNEFDLNYVTTRGANGLTAFQCGANSWNNIFRSKFVYSANTLTLINDGNTAIPTEPNIFENIRVYADTGATINVTKTDTTVMRGIVGDGAGTYSNDVRRYQNVELTNIIGLTDGATPALNAALGNTFRLTAAGNRTIAVPTNPTDGQKIVIEHTASGANRTLSLNTGTGGFAFGSDITALTATVSGTTDYIGCVYNRVANKWRVVAYVKGY